MGIKRRKKMGNKMKIKMKREERNKNEITEMVRCVYALAK